MASADLRAIKARRLRWYRSSCSIRWQFQLDWLRSGWATLDDPNGGSQPQISLPPRRDCANLALVDPVRSMPRSARRLLLAQSGHLPKLRWSYAGGYPVAAKCKCQASTQSTQAI